MYVLKYKARLAVLERQASDSRAMGGSAAAYEAEIALLQEVIADFLQADEGHLAVATADDRIKKAQDEVIKDLEGHVKAMEAENIEMAKEIQREKIAKVAAAKALNDIYGWAHWVIEEKHEGDALNTMVDVLDMAERGVRDVGGVPTPRPKEK